MTKGLALPILLLAACAPQPTPEAAPPAQPARTERAERAGPPVPPLRLPPPIEPGIGGFSADHVREWTERYVEYRLGREALQLARSAPTSIMATHHQGLPRPVQNADGSWGYEPPGANAMVRGSAGWTGWAGADRRAVSPAKAAEIDRILADRAFWSEADYVPPTCTDAGARRMVIRHSGRVTVRQQSCGGVGLTNRLWELVYGGP
jgi:hypothetical protein